MGRSRPLIVVDKTLTYGGRPLEPVELSRSVCRIWKRSTSELLTTLYGRTTLDPDEDRRAVGRESLIPGRVYRGAPRAVAPLPFPESDIGSAATGDATCRQIRPRYPGQHRRRSLDVQ
jgi:hypothetical protein